MAITLNTTNGFVPSSSIGEGKKGLHTTHHSTSDATLNGSNLSDGLEVKVKYPANSQDPHFKWTGITTGTSSDQTTCSVQLKQKKKHTGATTQPSILPTDGGSTVSVTATDTSTDPTTSSNTITPTVPLGS